MKELKYVVYLSQITDHLSHYEEGFSNRKGSNIGTQHRSMIAKQNQLVNC